MANFHSDEAKEKLLDRYNDLQFIDNDTELLCKRCHRVLIHHYIANCGHLFCRNCQRILGSHKGWKCPTCNADITDIAKQDVEVERRVSELKVRCPNCKYGCKQTGSLQEISEHLDLCEETREANLPALSDGPDNIAHVLEKLSMTTEQLNRMQQLREADCIKQQQMQTQLDSMQKTITGISSENTKMRETIADTRSRIEAEFSIQLKQHLHQVYGYITTINKKLASIDNKIAVNYTQMENINSKITSYDENMMRYDEKMTTCEKKMTTYEKNMTMFNKKMTVYDNDSTVIKTTVNNVDQKVASVDEQMTTTNGKVTSINKALSIINTTIIIILLLFTVISAIATIAPYTINIEMQSINESLTTINNTVVNVDKRLTANENEVLAIIDELAVITTNLTRIEVMDELNHVILRFVQSLRQNPLLRIIFEDTLEKSLHSPFTNGVMNKARERLEKANELATLGQEFGQSVSQFTWMVEDIEYEIEDATGEYIIESQSFYTDVPGPRVKLRLYPDYNNSGYIGVFLILVKGEFDDIISWPFTNLFAIESFGSDGKRVAVDVVSPEIRCTQFGVIDLPRPHNSIMCGSQKYINIEKLLSNKDQNLVNGSLNVTLTVYLVRRI